MIYVCWPTRECPCGSNDPKIYVFRTTASTNLINIFEEKTLDSTLRCENQDTIEKFTEISKNWDEIVTSGEQIVQ